MLKTYSNDSNAYVDAGGVTGRCKEVKPVKVFDALRRRLDGERLAEKRLA